MHEEQRLDAIISLVKSYDFQKPLVLFLRNHFRAHRNMGSRDRRIVTQSIYSLFRLGNSLASLPLPERIAIGLFLCSRQPDEFNAWCISKNSSLQPESVSIALKEKIEKVKAAYPFSLENIFPFKEYLSPEIDFEGFALSLLGKPGIFIRLRKKFRKEILKELDGKKIQYTLIPETNAVEIINSSRLEDLQTFQKGYFEIQDLSSQQTGNYFEPPAGSSWWDACAGSGGKSLLLHDRENTIKILATDSREKSLLNLKIRFSKAGIKNYRTRLIDLEKGALNTNDMFDGIIADTPCSGSGTWARSPAQFIHFDKKMIAEYAEKQKRLVKNILRNMDADSPLIYITCSVFAEENEMNIKYFSENFGLRSEASVYIKGYDRGADTLFVAKLARN
jgi:16S rRNA (cytosine967-C5)-methyltransferase